MIWKTEHIKTTIDLYSYAQQQNHPLLPSYDTTVAIIGGGPKGLYALNHFINQLHLRQPSKSLKILWFNSDIWFGCGPNYNIQQPDFLLINYCIGHLQAYHPAYSSTERQLHFMDWLNMVKTVDTPVVPTDFASRALVGHYLQWVGVEIMSRLPDNVYLQFIPQKVTSIQSAGEGTVETISACWKVDSVLLATGHCYENSPILPTHDIPRHRYWKSAYPVSQFSTISKQEKVGIVGLGLTFIDVALALTEGRGGIFDNGQYYPSGKEPRIFPFSRTSFPILCRSPLYKSSRPLYLLTDEWLMDVQAKKRKIDFCAEVLPLIEEEVQLAYYGVLWKMKEKKTIQAQIEKLDSARRFTLKDLLQPCINSSKAILKYIEVAIEEAHKGEEDSPLMAAAAVWSKASPFIAELYKAGGFTGESQRILDTVYFGAFNRISYGPPVENMEKIYALAKAGIIQFKISPDALPKWDPALQQFMLRCLLQEQLTLDVLIDARIARPSLQKNNAPFYNRLLQQGVIAPYKNQYYQPGTISLSKTGKCDTANHLLLYCYGSNTEGVFYDNDTLSRTKNDTAIHWVQETLTTLC